MKKFDRIQRIPSVGECALRRGGSSSHEEG